MKIDGIDGWMVLDEDNEPVQMDLCDDIAGGLCIDEPFPVFKTKSDAVNAGLQNAARSEDEATLKVVAVHVEFDMSTAETVKLTPEDDDEE